MPPFIPTKRRASTPLSEAPSAKKAKTTLFRSLDKSLASGSVQENKTFLAGLEGTASATSLSDVDSSDFEDVESIPISRKHVDDDEDEDEVDWEDAIQAPDSFSKAAPNSTGDLELTLDARSKGLSFTDGNKKKGPSKIERQIRISTHCMHVQYLMFHNLMRNAWTCDEEVQETLVSHLSATMTAEVEIWRRHSGLIKESNTKRNGVRLESHAFGEGPSRKAKHVDRKQTQRDWGDTADDLEKGQPNLSRGDPIKKLLKELSKFWKKRFTVTAPSLRKQGYKPPAMLEKELRSFQNSKHDSKEHGEKVEGIKEFRRLARKCEGSRDVGAQLFTALVRGLGIEARLVASLQPIGFGWNKTEEANVKKKNASKVSEETKVNDALNAENGSGADSKPGQASSRKASARYGESHSKVQSKTIRRPASKKQNVGNSKAPISLSGDSSELSAVSEDTANDDDSVIDMTSSARANKPRVKYDTDMTFPTYWIEVVSPINHRVYPVDPFILTTSVAENADQLAAFEPRGAKAEKAKIVLAYVVGFSSDGTAKDVTTRYLKRHMWPGKTKGFRMPIEKVPILNRSGKVKRYEEYDWFKTIMSPYTRTHSMRTACDDLEEQNELKPVKPTKKVIREGEETLQSYKQSADFVLERFLRREEALRPGSIPVKTFASGKGEKATQDPVYLRKDVMVCRTSESWHKEGRQVKRGQQPLKMVPVRAVTLVRKREVEDAERDTGEKLKQGMYAIDQTEYIIPPPIQNGRIPKNAYGNMDCFVPSMVPKGAVHIPLRSTMKICKRLGIDYAEAVTGFEFGNKRAVPVIMGVVVAAEHENLVIDEWEKDENERKIKEEGKREKIALGMWRKLLMGLRIVERVREEYGAEEGDHIREEVNPFTNKKKQGLDGEDDQGDDGVVQNAESEGVGEEAAGGFMVEEEEEPAAQAETLDVEIHDVEEPIGDGGGLVVEEPAIDTRHDPLLRPAPNDFKFTTGEYDTDTSDLTGYDTEKATDSKSISKKSNSVRGKASRASISKSKATSAKTSQRNSVSKKSKPAAKALIAEGDSSALSCNASSDSDLPVPSKSPKSTPRATRTPTRPTKIPTPSLPTRTSARQSARISETPLKSQYFEASDEDGDEDGDNEGSKPPGKIDEKSGDESQEDAYQPKPNTKGKSRPKRASSGMKGASGRKERGRPRKTI